MKIESINKAHAERTLKVCNETVKFDKNLVAEVEDKLGKEILTTLPGMFFEEGKVVLPEEPKEEYKGLEAKLEALTKENEELKGKVEELKKSEVEPVTLTEDDLALMFELSRKSKTNLIEDCEGLGFDKEEYEDKSQKELFIYVASKTL